tara:strand:- start:15 stop:593 length:579 start_codon:yes stop_codon:yes gene_type:complete
MENNNTITNNDNSKYADKLKEELENIFEKKMNILTNNLNFLLNSVNEEKTKREKLETRVTTLVNINKELQEKLDRKINLEDIDKYIDKNSKNQNNYQINDRSLDETIGTLETIAIDDDIDSNTDNREEHNNREEDDIEDGDIEDIDEENNKVKYDGTLDKINLAKLIDNIGTITNNLNETSSENIKQEIVEK